MTYRGAVRISAVCVFGVARAACDYHYEEYGPKERPQQERLRHQLLANHPSIPFAKYPWYYSRCRTFSLNIDTGQGNAEKCPST